MKKIFIFFLLSLVFLNGQALAQKLVYYADQAKPPLVDREPPFETSRRQVQKSFYYLNIRYPYQKKGEELKEGMRWKFSVGNESDGFILYQVGKIALTSNGKRLRVVPSFYNENLKKREAGWKALSRYSIRMPSHLHRAVTVHCLDCQGQHENLKLEVAVVVTSPEKKEIVEEAVDLYRGYYKVHS